jgi:hypothetical protein
VVNGNPEGLGTFDNIFHALLQVTVIASCESGISFLAGTFADIMHINQPIDGVRYVLPFDAPQIKSSLPRNMQIMYQLQDSDYYSSGIFVLVGLILLNFWLVSLLVAAVVKAFQSIRGANSKSGFGGQ